MALTRKFLAALGIESEKIDQIVEANAESLADIQDKLAKANAELKEANKTLATMNNNMWVELEKKRAELKRKGIVTAVSICLTIIPLVLPSNIGIDKEVVSSFLGGCTVKSVVDLIPEMLSLKDIEKENPFWVMWKWNNQSK